jgi:hypothetical protein
MAKKVVATLKVQGKGKDYSKVITIVKSPRTGAYLKNKLYQTITLKTRLPENFNGNVLTKI